MKKSQLKQINKRIVEERKKYLKMIKLWLENDAKDLTLKELKQIVHFCNGGDAIH
jgi:hypothetical protein